MQIKFNGMLTFLSENIKQGELLNEFVVVDSDLHEINSNDIKGIKLYLTLPSVDTPVCSLELSKFIQLLKNVDITIVSISMDLPFALNRWCQNNASDHVLTTSDFRYKDFADVSGLMMHEIGLFSRSVLLVDEHNIVRYIEIVDDVTHEPTYELVHRQITKLLKKNQEN